jgi:hypothetical protein
MKGYIPLLHPYVFMAWTKKNLALVPFFNQSHGVKQNTIRTVHVILDCLYMAV